MTTLLGASGGEGVAEADNADAAMVRLQRASAKTIYSYRSNSSSEWVGDRRERGGKDRLQCL